ncbi:hypothetical protein [Demequina mangrovi]|uniref:PknH-like extracellular domain-containing protein n=1 Tax=Demequina mangrovi TaxID=1043493 RepID=A0A1H6ZAJ9_9MICO|nr:hypothetical protein [Demequina mangrovi]SEJ50469.1 hypothetical protein SAMN05421637_2050 [Demequina mangrovi]
MGSVTRAGLIGALGMAAGLIAACDPVDPAEPGASASARASSADAVVGPADDEALVDLLGSFAPSIDGYVALTGTRSRPSPVAAYVVDAPDVVEPSSCTAFHLASTLLTDADLGAAARDLEFAVGWFFPGGVMPDEPPFVPSIEVYTRVFADPELAAGVPDALIGSGCDAYLRTATWDDGSNTLEHEVANVGWVSLEGLSSPTVRIAWAGGTATNYDAQGELVLAETREAWDQYVHVDGVNAISIETAGLEDEAMVADLIAQFLDHMAGG